MKHKIDPSLTMKLTIVWCGDARIVLGTPLVIRLLVLCQRIFFSCSVVPLIDFWEVGDIRSRSQVSQSQLFTWLYVSTERKVSVYSLSSSVSTIVYFCMLAPIKQWMIHS